MTEIKGLMKTYDYTKFKFGKWNRPLVENHVTEIINSIKKVGVIDASKIIVVNKNYEIFDGQHRFEAFRRLKEPIYFLIDDTLSVGDCGTLNSIVKRWSIEDYIRAYMNSDNANSNDYVILKNIKEKFPMITYKSIVIICTDKDKVVCNHDGHQSMIDLKKGKFTIQVPVAEIEKELEYISDCLKNITSSVKVGFLNSVEGKYGSPKGNLYWVNALDFIYRNQPQIDKKRLLEKIITRLDQLYIPANVHSALEQFENIYNYRLKGKIRADFLHDYKKSLYQKMRVSENELRT